MLLETLMKFSSRVAEQAKFRWLILISGRFWGSWSDFANMYNRCGPNLWQPSQPPKPNILTNWIYSSSFAVMQQSATEKERGRSGQFIKRELIFPKPFYFLTTALFWVALFEVWFYARLKQFLISANFCHAQSQCNLITTTRRRPEESIDGWRNHWTHQTIISFSMVYRMILLSHVFCSLIISYRLQYQSNTRTVLLCCLHTNTDQGRKRGHLKRDTGKCGTNLWHLFNCQL